MINIGFLSAEIGTFAPMRNFVGLLCENTVFRPILNVGFCENKFSNLSAASIRFLSSKNDDDDNEKPKTPQKFNKYQLKKKKRPYTIKANVVIPSLGGVNIVIPDEIEKSTRNVKKNFKKILSDLPVLQISHPLAPSIPKKIEVHSSTLNDVIKKSMTKNAYVGVFVSRDRRNGVVGTLDDIYPVGRLCHITQMIMMQGNVSQYIIVPLQRIKLIPKLESVEDKILQDSEIVNEPDDSHFAPSIPNETPVACCELLEYEFEEVSSTTIALCCEINNCIKQMSEFPVANIMASELYELESATPQNLADICPKYCFTSPEKLQSILSNVNLDERLTLLLECLKESLEVLKIRNKIHKKIEENIANNAKEYFMKEYMNEFQKIINPNKSTKKSHRSKFDARLKDLVLPEHVAVAYEEEIERLTNLDPSSLEHSLLVNYLDVLSSIPWGKFSLESLDLTEARRILDEDHYGIKDVKDRIIEFMAVAIQSQSTKGKIICLVGPPGVGKTSVAKSIARALNREYLRFSVGGIDDVCEIKGHRRTYVGAMPGKILQCLKKAKSMNPVILIDEIDKLSRSGRGDPSAALLECMDPEQNNEFLDHYLDLHIDLSKVLFICTANDLSTITPPLLDRMEVIEISGYINDEKNMIARKYSIPKILKEFGLETENVMLTDPALKILVEEYSREPGIRNLVKMLQRIYRKVVVKLQTGTPPGISVDSSDIREYLGSPSIPPGLVFQRDLPIGVATGLAYTGSGGEMLYIETAASRTASKPVEEKTTSSSSSSTQLNDQIYLPLQLTGRLGDVMKESCHIAYIIAKKLVKKYYPDNLFFETHRIHCHFPEGATPKDGPSAGIAIVSSLISLAMGQCISKNFAMSGEICLSELVLPVGGLKEKLNAALRNQVTKVILPEANRLNVEDLPKEITSLLTIHYVTNYLDVAKILFPKIFMNSNDHYEERLDSQGTASGSSNHTYIV